MKKIVSCIKQLVRGKENETKGYSVVDLHQFFRALVDKSGVSVDLGVHKTSGFPSHVSTAGDLQHLESGLHQ